MFGGVVM